MSVRTVTNAAMLTVLVLALGLAGAAGATSMALGEGAVFGDPNQLRDIQETIWFQGYIADAGTGEPVNATYAVTAEMFNAEIAGANVWGPETHVAAVITDGWFNIELGGVIGGLPAFDTPPYYLQLWVNGEMLEPRLKLASVPSAFQSLGADNGLNLPYAGAHGTSGNAFQITNTGPNICGYFVTNNAGSTAASLYGTHNGTGPAVLGWHSGSGSAIRGVANGDGYAGEFDGPAIVRDSMRVEGLFVAANNAIVPDTLMIGEGIWFANNPVEGYVLRCADSWGNAEWGPPNIIDTHNESSTTYVGGTVTQYDNAQVTLDVPGPGHIVVTSNVWFKFYHQTGIKDVLYLGHSTTPTSMGNVYDRVCWEVPADIVADFDLDRTFSVHSTFDVTSSGTYTYYLVGQMTGGADGGERFWFAQTTGIYYPYPAPVRSDEGEDAEFLKKMAELENQ